MVTCLVDKENVTRFPRAERLPTRTVLADEEFRYDEHFWEDFNIIPLEEELSKIIEDVYKRQEQGGYEGKNSTATDSCFQLQQVGTADASCFM